MKKAGEVWGKEKFYYFQRPPTRPFTFVALYWRWVKAGFGFAAKDFILLNKIVKHSC
jgi:hypothetical protein